MWNGGKNGYCSNIKNTEFPDLNQQEQAGTIRNYRACDNSATSTLAYNMYKNRIRTRLTDVMSHLHFIMI